MILFLAVTAAAFARIADERVFDSLVAELENSSRISRHFAALSDSSSRVLNRDASYSISAHAIQRVWDPYHTLRIHFARWPSKSPSVDLSSRNEYNVASVDLSSPNLVEVASASWHRVHGTEKEVGTCKVRRYLSRIAACPYVSVFNTAFSINRRYQGTSISN